MNFGFASAILPDLSFEEVVAFAAENGYRCVEMMCWPMGKAERRYAGVTHVDVATLDEQKATELNACLDRYNVHISALGYYPNPLDPDPEKSAFFVQHIHKMIDAAKLLGLHTVNTFIGRDKTKTVAENLQRFEQVWRPIIAYAEQQGIRVAIENCPMLFTKDEWPGGLNLATTPAIWREMFRLIPSANFGLNYDPSHLVWQQIDYIKPIYEFRDRIFHVHFKDVKVYRDKLDQVGIMGMPLEYFSPKLPGLGDVDWGKFVSALTDIGYRGDACVEVEDKAFEDSLLSRQRSLRLSRNFLSQYLY